MLSLASLLQSLSIRLLFSFPWKAIDKGTGYAVCGQTLKFKNDFTLSSWFSSRFFNRSFHGIVVTQFWVQVMSPFHNSFVIRVPLHAKVRRILLTLMDFGMQVIPVAGSCRPCTPQTSRLGERSLPCAWAPLGGHQPGSLGAYFWGWGVHRCRSLLWSRSVGNRSLKTWQDVECGDGFGGQDSNEKGSESSPAPWWNSLPLQRNTKHAN